MTHPQQRRHSHCLPGLTATQSQQVRSLTRVAPAEPLTPDQIRTGVHLRLVQLDAEKAPSFTYARPLGGGFHELLVHKDGEFVRWIHDRELAGVDVEEMRELGRQRLLDIEPDEVEILTKEDALALCIRGESGFIASKLLVLREFLAPLAGVAADAGDGFVVAVPSRHELIVAPVDHTIEAVLDVFEVLTDFDHSHDHALISSVVHWWTDGHVHPLFDAGRPGRSFLPGVPTTFRAIVDRHRGDGAA